MTPTDQQRLYALDARTILALTLYGESRGEPVEGIVAVGCVVRNRVQTHYRGRSYHEVVLAPKQFSCWNDDDANQPILLAMATRLASENINDDVAWRECLLIAMGIVTNTLRDRVGRARHYHGLNASPEWSAGKVPVAQFRNHVFYEDVA